MSKLKMKCKKGIQTSDLMEFTKYVFSEAQKCNHINIILY